MFRTAWSSIALASALLLVGGCASSRTESVVLSDSRVYRDDQVAAQCATKDRLGVMSTSPCAVGIRRVPIGGEVVYKRDGACFRDVYVPNGARSGADVNHRDVPCPEN